MLPSILARQYQEGLINYIDTSFPITNSIFKDSMREMLHNTDKWDEMLTPEIVGLLTKIHEFKKVGNGQDNSEK